VRKSIHVVVAVVLAALSVVAAAYSHSLIASGNVYDGGKQCVYNFTVQRHDNNSVQVQSLTDSVSPINFPKMACGFKNPRPNGYLAGRWESFKWGPNVGAWILCGSMGWEYGGGWTFTLGRDTTGCGAGWYALAGYAYVYNGGWLGGGVVTDYDWLWG
jgi:hypothetical protein